MNYKKISAFILAGTIAAGTMLTGCGSNINQSAVLATFGDKEITLGFANFMAKYQQATYDSYYSGMFGDGMWSRDIYGEGNTLEEDVKEDVLEDIENLYALDANKDEYDVEISDEDNKKIEEAADKFLSDNSNKAISLVGATKEYIVEMLRLDTIRDRMYDKIIENVDENVTDEEAAQRTFSYVEINKPIDEEADGDTEDGEADEETEGEASETADTGTEGSASDEDELTEEELLVKENAEEFAEAAKSDFDTAASDEGYDVSTASYGSAEDEDPALDEEVLKVADGLKEGEVSDLIETDDAYYVIRLDSEFDADATESRKTEIVSERKADTYEAKLDEYKKDVDWEVDEDLWSKVTFTRLFTNVDENAKEEASEETESGAVSDTAAADTEAAVSDGTAATETEAQ